MKLSIVIFILFCSQFLFADEKMAQIKASITQSIIADQVFPLEIEIDKEKFYPEYTLNNELQSYVENLLKRYRSDYSVVVVIENGTGNILAMSGLERIDNKQNLSLALSNSHPAASLFKLVTAMSLIDDAGLDPNSKISFRGRGTTLYKHQIQQIRPVQEREITLEKAFATSNNPAFGKAAVNNLNLLSLVKKSLLLGFNSDLMSDIDVQKSKIKMPLDNYELAELASGYNVETTISPLHAAIIVSSIANNCKTIRPKLISKIRNENHEEFKFGDEDFLSETILATDDCNSLKNIMKSVVQNGTAKSLKKRINKNILSRLEIGGKTGSLTGGIPFGKRDWFISYSKDLYSPTEEGISISVMNINKKKWYVKSSEIAGDIFNFYYKSKK
jgi:peptidoglycan glycosyltransferase